MAYNVTFKPLEMPNFRSEKDLQRVLSGIIKRYNEDVVRWNSALTSIERTKVAGTIVVAGGSTTVVGGSSGTGSGDASLRAGKQLLTADTEATISFSAPILGSFILNKPRCYDSTDPKINVDVEIYDISSSGFKAKAALDSYLEWSTTGIS